LNNNKKKRGGIGVEKLKNGGKSTSMCEEGVEYFLNTYLGIVHKKRKVVSCNNYCEYAMIK